MFRGIDVVSSRSARLLGGNRTIAEPFEFIAGLPVSAQPVKKMNDSAGGLFAGTSGPKPPPALSTAVLGMRRGGKVGAVGSTVMRLPFLFNLTLDFPLKPKVLFEERHIRYEHEGGPRDPYLPAILGHNFCLPHHSLPACLFVALHPGGQARAGVWREGPWRAAPQHNLRAQD